MTRTLEVVGRLRIEGPGCRVMVSGSGEFVDVRLSGFRGLPTLFRTYQILRSTPVPDAMSAAGIRLRVRWGRWIPLWLGGRDGR